MLTADQVRQGRESLPPRVKGWDWGQIRVKYPDELKGCAIYAIVNEEVFGPFTEDQGWDQFKTNEGKMGIDELYICPL